MSLTMEYRPTTQTMFQIVFLLLVVTGLSLAYHYDLLGSILLNIDPNSFSTQLSIILLFIPVAIFFLPASLAITGCGALFDSFTLAYFIAFIGYVLGAVFVFFLSRYVFRELVIRKIKSNHKIHTLFELIHRQELKMLVICRLSPMIPYGPTNYIFGASEARFKTFLGGTLVSNIPIVLLYTLIGSTASNINQVVRDDVDQPWYYLPASIVAGIITLVGVIYFSRRAMKLYEELREEHIQEKSRTSLQIEADDIES